LGLLPGWFTPVTLAVFPAGAFVLAWIFYHRTGVTEAARLVDAQMETHDLFLTASLIEHSLGAYQGLVLKEAGQQASRMLPQKIVPYHWQRDTFRICAALAVSCFAVYLLPQFDPFRLHRRQRQLAEQREWVREISKATGVRAALLERKRAGAQTDVVKQAVASLEKHFKTQNRTTKSAPRRRTVFLVRLHQKQSNSSRNTIMRLSATICPNEPAPHLTLCTNAAWLRFNRFH
jgi:hypothetical protein